MKKTTAILAFAALSALAGCKDEENSVTPGATDTKGYYPLTPGTEWTYEINDGGTIMGRTETVSRDTNLAGSTFRHIDVVRLDSSRSRMYLRRSNDTVYTAAPSRKRSLAVVIERQGASWTTSDTVNNGNTINTITSTIIAKGISRTVHGKTYNDVLHLRWTSEYTHDGQTSQSSADNYFAKRHWAD